MFTETPWDHEVDVLCIGAEGGVLATGVVAASSGLDVYLGIAEPTAGTDLAASLCYGGGDRPTTKHLAGFDYAFEPRTSGLRALIYSSSVTELLFSYGTLRQRDVQLCTFGRELDGRPDAIVGYELDYVTITDPHVIATSGTDRHPILKPSRRPDAAIEGTVFAISSIDLAAADEYEVDDYRRVAVPLRSGEQAWVYVFAKD